MNRLIELLAKIGVVFPHNLFLGKNHFICTLFSIKTENFWFSENKQFFCNRNSLNANQYFITCARMKIEFFI